MMSREIKKILVVRTDRIGDVVLTLPAINAIRRAYPKAQITMLVTSVTRELVDEYHGLDVVMIDDRQDQHKGFFGWLKLVTQIRKEKFDCAIIYHTKRRTNVTCFLAGIPRRIGFQNKKFGFLLNEPIEDARPSGAQHEAQYCLDVLKSLNINSTDTSINLPVSERSIQWADELWQKEGLNGGMPTIALHPGASDPSKQWPEYRFSELIQALGEKYQARVMVIGSLDIANTAKEICEKAGAHALDYSGRTTLGQLCALLKKCKLLISNDSGPVHVASGVGTPVVSIFTRNQPGINPERWAPLESRSQVVTVTPAQSADYSFEKAGSAGAEYLELIDTNTVLEAVDAVFKLC